MVELIKQNHIFSKAQFGFHSGLSTESSAYFIDKIHNDFNNKGTIL